MNKGKSNKIILIVLATLLLTGGIILIYLANSTKNNLDDNSSLTNDSNIDDKNSLEDLVNNLTAEYGSMVLYFNSYIDYIPLRFSDSNLVSYQASELTDQEISMAIWRYIYHMNDGFATDPTTLTIDEINHYLKEYLNKENYQVVELEETEEFIFGLHLENNNYVITASQIEFSFPSFEVVDVNVDYDTKKVLVYANQIEVSDDNLNVVNSVVLELEYNNDYFNVVSFTINSN